jgi:hypothetical protein
MKKTALCKRCSSGWDGSKVIEEASLMKRVDNVERATFLLK